MPNIKYSSRAGEKLAFAIEKFGTIITDKVCADLGCSTGGFTSCLLQNYAKKVYAVDTGHGVLDYKLRIDPRVVVMERTNAMHVTLPESVDLIAIDVGWTPQRLILPHAKSLLNQTGLIVSLIKPHYEVKKAKLTLLESESVFKNTQKEITNLGFNILNSCVSPILGGKGQNIEYLVLIIPHVKS